MYKWQLLSLKDLYKWRINAKLHRIHCRGFEIRTLKHCSRNIQKILVKRLNLPNFTKTVPRVTGSLFLDVVLKNMPVTLWFEKELNEICNKNYSICHKFSMARWTELYAKKQLMAKWNMRVSYNSWIHSSNVESKQSEKR